MTIILLLPAIVALAGLLLYFVAQNPKVSEAGRILLLAGMIGVCVVGAWGGYSGHGAAIRAR